MTVRRIRSAALAALAVVASLATSAVAGPWRVAPGEYYSELSGSVFSSGDYLDDQGERTLSGGLTEQRMLSSYSELGWKKNWSLRLGLPIVSRTVRANALPGSATSTGLGDLLLGVKRAGHVGGLAAALQFTWTAPMGENRLFQPGVNALAGTNGDAGTFDTASQGLQSLEADLGFGGSAGTRAYWSVQGGYRYRYAVIGGRTKSAEVADTLMAKRRWQDAMIADAELGVWFTRSLLVSGQVHADLALDQGDLYDGVFAANPGANGPEYESRRVIAGPRLTYRVDEKLDAFAGSWHTASGRNTLHTDLYYAGIAWKSTKLDRLAGLLGGTSSR